MLDRDGQEISLIIEEGLDAILSGRASLGEVLRQHPDLAARLQPELEAALWLIARQQQVAPRPGFLRASRMRLVERIRREGLNRNARTGFLMGLPWSPPQRVFQWAAALVLLIIFFASTSGVLSMAQDTLPEQFLYPVKRASEEVAIGLTWSDVRKADLRVEFTKRRFNEIEALISRGEDKALAEALSDFEEQINQSVVLLQEIGDKHIDKKGELANQMLVDFTEYANRLDALKPVVPGQVRASLDKARDVSLTSASIAGDVYEDVRGKKTRDPDEPEPADTLLPDGGRREVTEEPGDVVQPPTGKDKQNPKDLNPPEKIPKPTKTPKPDKVLPVDPDVLELKPTKVEKDKIDKEDK